MHQQMRECTVQGSSGWVVIRILYQTQPGAIIRGNGRGYEGTHGTSRSQYYTNYKSQYLSKPEGIFSWSAVAKQIKVWLQVATCTLLFVGSLPSSSGAAERRMLKAPLRQVMKYYWDTGELVLETFLFSNQSTSFLILFPLHVAANTRMHARLGTHTLLSSV